MSKNPQRQINWLYQFGYVNIMTTYTVQKYLLKVSVAQATILLQFDEQDKDVLTVGQLGELTMLS